MTCRAILVWQSHRHYVQWISLPRMKTRVTDTILTFLLLLGCSFFSSCSSEPAIQSDNVVMEQTKEKEKPKPLEDVIVASEDEVPTWDQSADKTKPSSEKTDLDN